MTDNELTIYSAQQEAERLRQELAELRAKQQEQQRINSDTQVPLITILSSTLMTDAAALQEERQILVSEVPMEPLFN